MVRIKVDNRIRWLMERNRFEGHRSFFAIVGEQGNTQIPVLYHILNKIEVKARPRVLWCFKKQAACTSTSSEEIGSNEGRSKKMKKLQKKLKSGSFGSSSLGSSGLFDSKSGGEDPLHLFVASTNIRYCYYKESHKVLGQTFGVLILQDFEAITPNVLARTIETVEGGGLVILLLQSVQSLKQLYTMSMDVHSRYRTEAFKDQQCVVPRFNERFILSLASNSACLIIDDKLNVISCLRKTKGLDGSTSATPFLSQEAVDEAKSRYSAPQNDDSNPLKAICDNFIDSQPTHSLLKLCKTCDQAKALLQFIDALTEMKLDRTVSLTAGRGRGKSAALGLAIAASIGFGYCNIFVTSPTPENLSTLFEFILKGFDAMKYEEHVDYDVIQSTNPDFNNAIVQIKVHDQSKKSKSGNSHFSINRQIIQYIHPSDFNSTSSNMSNVELLVIDEAAAIPLPLVRQMLGPYLVFLSSTVSGYEGTGRSLSLKLIEELRHKQRLDDDPNSSKGSARTSKNRTLISPSALGNRILREVTLEESIRYKSGDHMESWLNRLLCLDVNIDTNSNTDIYKVTGCPLPSECNLYFVNRDTLFSHHPSAESFLHSIMSLMISSHYKNSPNDLQMLSDAPSHHLYVLLGPTNDQSTKLPEILSVMQVCLEGRIKRSSINHGLSRGERAHGDLIPWTLCQQYQDHAFGELSGCRIVRVATHPDYQSMGYGSRAIDMLMKYYGGEIVKLDDDKQVTSTDTDLTISDDALETASDIQSTIADCEILTPRANLPPLLMKLEERKPEYLDYVGVSYGLTQPLLRFWKKAGFIPVYLRQTPNDLTGEHTTIMVRNLRISIEPAPTQTPDWHLLYFQDFKCRFARLLSHTSELSPTKVTPTLALSMLSSSNGVSPLQKPLPHNHNKDAISSMLLNEFDLRRLRLYGNNMSDYHLITDLMTPLAFLYFIRSVKSSSFKVTVMQEVILVGLGFQGQTVDQVSKHLGIAPSQVLGLLNRMVRKFVGFLSNEVFRKVEDKVIEKSVLSNSVSKQQPLGQSMEEELEEAGLEVQKSLKKSTKTKRSTDLLQSIENESIRANRENLVEDDVVHVDNRLAKYCIGGSNADWEAATGGSTRQNGNSGNSDTNIEIPNILSIPHNKDGDRKRREDGSGGDIELKKKKKKKRDNNGKKRKMLI